MMLHVMLKDSTHFDHNADVASLREFVKECIHSGGIFDGNGFVLWNAVQSIEEKKIKDAPPQANDQSGNTEASGAADGAASTEPTTEPTANTSESTELQPASEMPDAGTDGGSGQPEAILPTGDSTDESHSG